MIHKAKIESIGKSPADYHKDVAPRGSKEFVCSSSMLREFSRCPSRWLAGYQSPDSEAKDWGNLFDCLMLTPDDFNTRYAVKPATYKDAKTGEQKPWNGNSTVCKEWLADHADKESISNADAAEGNAAVKKAFQDDIIKAFVESSDKQVYLTGQWKDKDTGLIVPLKGLLDLVPRLSTEFAKSLGDVKTTRNGAVMPWQRWCHTAGYHVQAALYLDLYQAATGEDRADFCFILSENYPPYQTAKRLLSQDFTEFGRDYYKRALKNYCACLKSNRWPNYDEHDEAIQTSWTLVSPEPWMQNADAFAPKFSFDEPTEPTQESDEVTP